MLTFAALAKDKKRDPDSIGDRNVAKGVNFYSLDKEVAPGKSMAEEIEHESHIVDDPVISEYVNRPGQAIVRNSDAKVPFTIRVIESDEVNAFALPGGFLFVNTGLILNADNEAELAGVMSHEIAHVAARPGTRQATCGQLISYAGLPLITMGGWTGYAIQQGASMALPLGFLKFSRAFENEADVLGLEYMYKSGYDPTAFVDFFEKIQSLEKRKPSAVANLFSTHPPTEGRIERAQNNIQAYLKAKPDYIVTTSEFYDVKERLRNLQSGRKADGTAGTSKPTLKRRTQSGTVPVRGGSDEPDDDDRPTLKRR